MEIVGVATNICRDKGQGLSLWPLDAEAGLATAAYDYLVGATDVATVMVRDPIGRLTSRENDCMRSAVVAALHASGVSFDRGSVVYSGPTSETVIEIARRLAEL